LFSVVTVINVKNSIEFVRKWGYNFRVLESKEDIMAFIDWDESFVVGVPEVDEQHKHLIFIVNHFLETVSNSNMNKSGEDLYRIIDSTLSELIDYTIYHFSTEEKLLSLYGYPDLAEHRAEHRSLINKAFNLSERLKESHTSVSAEDLAGLLDKWLVSHIRNSDGKYAKYFSANHVEVA
jgi:hemerythrin-like metal-binding protein